MMDSEVKLAGEGGDAAAEYSDMKTGLAIVDKVLAELDLKREQWEDSNAISPWKYATVALGPFSWAAGWKPSLRLGVSSGGVISVDGDPFAFRAKGPHELKIIVTEDRALQAIREAAMAKCEREIKITLQANASRLSERFRAVAEALGRELAWRPAGTVLSYAGGYISTKQGQHFGELVFATTGEGAATQTADEFLSTLCAADPHVAERTLAAIEGAASKATFERRPHMDGDHLCFPGYISDCIGWGGQTMVKIAQDGLEMHQADCLLKVSLNEKDHPTIVRAREMWPSDVAQIYANLAETSQEYLDGPLDMGEVKPAPQLDPSRTMVVDWSDGTSGAVLLWGNSVLVSTVFFDGPRKGEHCYELDFESQQEDDEQGSIGDRLRQ